MVFTCINKKQDTSKKKKERERKKDHNQDTKVSVNTVTDQLFLSMKS